MKLFTRLALCLICTFAVSGTLSPAYAQETVRIRMGTVVPEGSPWHEALLHIRQDWRRISGGRVDLRIYPGGVLGDGVECVRQVRSGALDACALSSIGLEQIDSAINCLQIPMMFDSYEELDYVRDRLAARLEQTMKESGFQVLNWSDGGWVHFFSKTPARTPDDIRDMKLFISAGDPEAERIYKELKFHVVPLSAIDMVTSLQTGMIDAFDVPPVFALLNGSYKLAPNMIPIKWAPLVGGTVISNRAWRRIPEDLRADMLAAARQAGDRLRPTIRKMGDDAVAAMQKRGLTVVRLSDDEREQWRAEAEAAYPRLRGDYVDAELFDEVQRLRDEFRQNPVNPAVN